MNKLLTKIAFGIGWVFMMVVSFVLWVYFIRLTALVDPLLP